MGKRSRHRQGHKNGMHHTFANKHNNKTPFRKEQHSSLTKHKHPQQDLHKLKHNSESLNERPRSENESYQSPTSPAPDRNGAFSSRKRSLLEVDFVYPRKNGKKDTYRFVKMNEAKTNADGHEAETEETPTKQKVVHTKGIQEILYPSRQRTPSEELTSNVVHNQRTALDGETSISAEGHLSGRSVEDAVKDRVGCRPRSNSTDGELNLPQRGLCDERTVLESYRWKFDRCEPKGFKNLGNTCYLNSTLQCLAHIPPFCQSLLTLSSSNGGNSQETRSPSQGKKITLMLKHLFTKAHAANGSLGSSIAPRQIVNAVPNLGSIGSRGGHRFRPGRQEDCHEFLVHLLDAMNDGELRQAGINQHKSGWRDRLPIPRLDETTFIHRIFGGYFRSQVRCTRCDYKSNTYDPFLDLSLEVSKHSCNSILDALNDFTRKEKLDNENRWKCSGCKNLVCATKQLTVFRPPLALCIQLKRFAFSSGFRGLGGFGFGGGFGGGKKISKPIDFPSSLNLPLSDGRSCRYSLTGVVMHLGGSATSGHYTACIKKPSSEEGRSSWFHVDDSFVEPISERTVLRQRDAYLLFYCREEVKIEYPTPPLRSSMSAEEAKERGRIRSLVRGGLKTLDSSEIGPTKDIEVKPERDVAGRLRPEIGKRPEAGVGIEDKTNDEETSKASNAESSSSSSSDDSSDSDNSSSMETTEGKDIDAKPSTSEEMSPGGENTRKSDATPSTDTITKSASAESKKVSYAIASQSEGPDNVAVEIKDRRKSDNNATPHNNGTDNASQSDPDSSDDSSASSSSLSASSKISSDESTEEESTGKPSAKNKVNHPEQSTPDHAPRTKISLDRGEGREKVSVMLGPRFSGRGWSPGVTAMPKGSDYDLLGNVAVGKWGDEDDEVVGKGIADAIANRRTALVSFMTKSEKSRKKRMYLDGWDAALDRGKRKKVKGTGTPNDTHRYGTQNLRFQRIQASVQKMNRGRAKGYFRNGGGKKKGR